LEGWAFLKGISSNIHTIWLAHSSLPIFVVLTTSGSENRSYNSLLYLTQQRPFSHMGSNILQNTFLADIFQLS
jgi:hypothetical protein